MTDSEIIRLIGEALFGSQWQSDLAKALGVSSRTVRRWVASEDRPRPGVWQDLRALLLDRERRIREILESEQLASRLQAPGPDGPIRR
jgi:hypothetical protein